MRLGSAVKLGGTYLFRTLAIFKDLNNLDDYFNPNKLIMAIIETRLADKLLSLMSILTS
jgi:hypothetical protein